MRLVYPSFLDRPSFWYEFLVQETWIVCQGPYADNDGGHILYRLGFTLLYDRRLRLPVYITSINFRLEQCDCDIYTVDETRENQFNYTYVV